LRTNKDGKTYSVKVGVWGNTLICLCLEARDEETEVINTDESAFE